MNSVGAVRKATCSKAQEVPTSICGPAVAMQSYTHSIAALCAEQQKVNSVV
ncbi:hypothetical protein U370_03935 [Anaplasma marginale str. Dawn]|uniref:hypothetical protein n=1 Tax=Anaplasma marginale TaxID=770 RepID=UPI0001B463A9|nr:hypothetical protein [Anaplasma marginale]AGZ79109.1 hypothetical protein U128_04085 [Anaplasma marginale str. Gypsy Plains]AGZ79912.1 hypothetical protein U370_03935 [Anaplasma marginale str. Dawn]